MTDVDVLVIGGGPAGSTAAALLAREGRRVLVVDKARFPRYHIGESLLPAVLLFLEELGVREEVERTGFHRKVGQTFVWGRDAEPWDLDFRALDAYPYSFFVDRARFDHILLANAAKLGAEVREGARVTEVVEEDGRVVGATVEGLGAVRARWVIDASGQSALLAHKQSSRQFMKGLKSLAIWAYFTDVGAPPPPRDDHIYSIAVDDGWVWWIPLAGGIASVGVVTNDLAGVRRGKGSEEKIHRWYEETVRQTPIVKDFLQGARRTEGPFVQRDWSYRATRFHGPGWLLAGDAACFIDPILSTGVNLAMSGGYLAALALHSTLGAPAHEQTFLHYFQRAYRDLYDEQLESIRHFYAVAAHRDSVYWKAKRLLRVDPGLERDLAFVFINSGLARHVTARSPNDVAGQARTLFGSKLPENAGPTVPYVPRAAERQLVPGGDVTVVEGSDRRLYGLVQRGFRLELEPYAGEKRPDGAQALLELESLPEREPLGVVRIEPVRPDTPPRVLRARGFAVSTRSYLRDERSAKLLGAALQEIVAIVEKRSEADLPALATAVRRALRGRKGGPWGVAARPTTDRRDLSEQPVSAEYQRIDGARLWVVARPRRPIEVDERPFARTRFVDVEYRTDRDLGDGGRALLAELVDALRGAVARRDRLSTALVACEQALAREAAAASDWRLVAVRRVGPGVAP